MRCVPDLAPDSQALQLWRQDIEHGSAGDERSGTQGNLEFIRSTVVVFDNLVFPLRHLHRIKGGDFWRREVVQGSIDVPAVETGVTLSSVFWGNLGLVEVIVLRVLQLGLGETFVVVYSAVPDQLNLGDSRDRLNVLVKDGF